MTSSRLDTQLKYSKSRQSLVFTKLRGQKIYTKICKLLFRLGLLNKDSTLTLFFVKRLFFISYVEKRLKMIFAKSLLSPPSSLFFRWINQIRIWIKTSCCEIYTKNILPLFYVSNTRWAVKTCKMRAYSKHWNVINLKAFYRVFRLKIVKSKRL